LSSSEDLPLTENKRNFLDGVLIELLNILGKKNIETRDVPFFGTNDIHIFSGTNITIFSFSKSRRFIQPLYAERPLSAVIADESSLSINEPGNSENKELSKYLIDELKCVSPLSILFPNTYLTLKDEELKESIKKVAYMLVEPIKEDLDRRKRIVRINPIFAGRDFIVDPRLCFVIMEYKPPYTDIYETLIKPTVESEGFECLKANDIYSTTSVIEDIWANINKAALIIAEITSNNSNVLYELGICHTIGKNVMMITQKQEDIPFNFRHMRCYPYKNDIPGSRELIRNIKSVIGHLKAI